MSDEPKEAPPEQPTEPAPVQEPEEQAPEKPAAALARMARQERDQALCRAVRFTGRWTA
jgi:hypothetical protein